jgi:hypothetical protein
MITRVITKDEDKRALISRLSRAHAELALFCEELAEPPPGSKELRNGVVVIPPPYDFDELEKSWSYGNWNLISPAKTHYEPLNTFKLADSEIAQAMRFHGLSLIIDSFHDNIEWKVHENA